MSFGTPRRTRRRTSAALGTATALTLGTLAAAGTLSTAPASAAPSPSGSSLSAEVGSTGADLDLRQPATAAAKSEADVLAARTAASAPLARLKAALGDQAVVDIDSTTLTPRNVSRLDGFLTGPSGAAPADVALGYVTAHADVFRLTPADLAGLSLARAYVDVEGITHLSWVQKVGGRTLFGNGLKANVAKDGSLINVQGSPVAGLKAPTAPTRLTADAAITAAKASLQAAKTAPAPGDTAAQVVFSTPGGTRPAYQVVNMTVARPALTVVDAESGRVLYRQSLTDDAAPANETATVFTNYPGAPHGGTQQKVDLTAKGWLSAGSVVLFGNNVHTYSDVNDNNAPDPTEEVSPAADGTFRFSQQRVQAPKVWRCATAVCTWLPGQPYSWQVNRSQTSTQNFFYINAWHDHLAAGPIGFTEAAGNFQQVNSSGNGAGSDPVQDEPLDGASTANGLPDGNHIDNANFATPPDGTAPRMQMYLFNQPGSKYPTEDPFLPIAGSDEADIVYHEYTHGLSNRLVVGPDNVSALTGAQGGAMGEAWSDWYALDYLVDQGLIKDGPKPGEQQVQVGKYTLPQESFRTEPIDCTVGAPAATCPGTKAAGPGGFTYGDFGKIAARGPEVHADGEIWAQTLWDLRRELGTATSESLVTRAMELSPTNPSFLDMRNAILQADRATRKGADTATLWKIFAHRGMGFFAGTVTTNDVTPVEDFSVPPAAGTAKVTVSGRVVDNRSGAGVADAVVAFGGHDSGFPGSYAATTDSSGRYLIPGVFPGTYPDVYAAGPGYDSTVRTVTVPKTGLNERFELVRDWAAASGGASITATNDNTYAPYGCGAGALIDQGVDGWVADKPAAGADAFAVVTLPVAVDISKVFIDPLAGCGVDASASTADYVVETSHDGTTFRQAAKGTFTPAQDGQLNPVALANGTGTGVKAVRYRMLTNQVSAFGVSCPGGYSGCYYVSTNELEVRGTKH